jgi:Mg/Co/Ni transporter MgtE
MGRRKGGDMPESSSARQRLAEEIENLSEEEAVEVLEYISIMRLMKEEERHPEQFQRELLSLLSQPERGSAPASRGRKSAE